MSIHIDGKKITAMYWAGRKIREAWYGGQRVFSGKPVEVMPATPGTYDARDWLRGKLAEYGEDYRTVKELPFEIDSSQVTNMYSMFRDCSSMTTVPEMDTSQVTNMQHMFRDCSSMTTVPDMDTSQVTNMGSMFFGCSSLVDVPPMDTSRATSTGYIFNGCSSLTSVPDMDTSQVTYTAYMFNGCSSLTSVPDMDTSQVTYTGYMFNGCSQLTDGNVRLIGKHPNVSTTGMINNSGLTREPFYDASGRPI